MELHLSMGRDFYFLLLKVDELQMYDSEIFYLTFQPKSSEKPLWIKIEIKVFPLKTAGGKINTYIH